MDARGNPCAETGSRENVKMPAESGAVARLTSPARTRQQHLDDKGAAFAPRGFRGIFPCVDWSAGIWTGAID